MEALFLRKFRNFSEGFGMNNPNTYGNEGQTSTLKYKNGSLLYIDLSNLDILSGCKIENADQNSVKPFENLPNR